MIRASALAGAMLLFIASAVGGYGFGWKTRGDHEAANQLTAAKEHQRLLERERERGNVLAADLEAEKRNVKTVTIEVIKEIPKVTTVYVERANEAPKPIPPAVITFGAVRLFNHALRPDLLPTAGELAYPPGTTHLTRAPLDLPDILAVHTENAGKYAECRAQLNKLIDWHEAQSAARKTDLDAALAGGAP